MQLLPAPQLRGGLASIAEDQDLHLPIGTGLKGEDDDQADRSVGEKLQAIGVASVDEVGVDAVRVGPGSELLQVVVEVTALHHLGGVGCQIDEPISAADVEEGVKIGHVHVPVGWSL